MVLHPTRHKIGHFGDVSPNRLGMGKKLKPDSVALYENWPVNAVGLFSKEKISKEN